MFEMNDDKGNNQQLPSKCRLLEIEHNGNKMFIYKTTAVWLFQEGELVSADRLFRVRETQPYRTNLKAIPSNKVSISAVAVQQPVPEVGNICVFLKKRGDSMWQIGKVLQFAYYLEKTKRLDSTEQPLLILKRTLERLVFCVHGSIKLKQEYSHLNMMTLIWCHISFAQSATICVLCLVMVLKW